MSIKVLDCTLRDGAYVVDSDFGIECIGEIVNGLTSAGIDIIECGWLRDCKHKEGSVFYNVPEDFKQKKSGSKYALMFDYGKYDIKNLSSNSAIIDIIRIAFNHSSLNDIQAAVEHVQEKGYEVFLQPSNTIEYSDEEIKKLCKIANSSRVSAIYIVDSFGSMFPKDLDRISSLYSEFLTPEIQIGFHSHNSIQLSFALSIQFAEKMMGDIIIDSSLCGIGRGAGNTKTELLVEYLKNYKTEYIWETIRRNIIPFYNDYSWEYTPEKALKGLRGLHPYSKITF